MNAADPRWRPFLRVPTPAGGPASAPWSQVRTTPDGTAILLADPDGYLDVVTTDATAPLDALSFSGLAHLSRYLPQLLAPNAPLRRAIRSTLATYLPRRAALAVEFGCSVGPDLRTLAHFSDSVIAFDASIAAVRAARMQLAGLPVPLLRRVEGRAFETEAPIELPPVGDVLVLVGDAHDPPIAPTSADLVLAMNLLDSIARPLDLVGQLDATLKPGGLLVLASPFAWSDAITAPEEALGGGTAPDFAQLGSARALVELLSGHLPVLPHLAYDLLAEDDVPWSLRDHARAVTHYDVHLLVARKRAA